MSTFKRAICFSITGLVLASAMPAQQRFTLEMARRVVRLSSPAAAPDGRTVAVVVTRSNYADDRMDSELHAVDLASGSHRQLTYARDHVSQPAWSPDGKTLAFVAPDTAHREQVWLMPMSGGDARQLTASPTGVSHYSC
jgi:Tol biopolymer transport system component